MNIAQQLNTYLKRHHATTIEDNNKIIAEFNGEYSTMTAVLRETLDYVIGSPSAITSAYYIDLVNKANTPYDNHYRLGDDVPWQHAERAYGMPVIIHHHARTMRPEARPNPDNQEIANSADLILPGAGTIIEGYETREGRIHLTINLNALEIHTSHLIPPIHKRSHSKKT